MTSFPSRDESVQLVKEAADIVEIIGEHVDLQKAGANFKGRCPFHSEKTPSFMVNPARRSFHCFGCNEGGDIFSFHMKYHNTTFPESLKELARRYNITLPEKQLSHKDQERARHRTGLYDILERGATVFHELLLTDKRAAGAREYLRERKIPDEVIRKFRLGYAPDSWDFLTGKITKPGEKELASEAGLIVKKERGGFYDRFRDRLLCPIMNMTGQVAGFSGRILGDGQPKYMNSPENLVFDKGRLLYGLFQNRESIRKRQQCLLVEGNFDLLALAANGLDFGAAPLGTALTKDQVRILKGYAREVVILFDGDSAGVKAAMRSVPIFLAERVEAKVCMLPKGHDPDTFIREHGPDVLELEIKKATSLPEFAFKLLSEEHGLGLEGKTRIATELNNLVKDLSDNQIEKSIFISHFSQKLGIRLDQLQKSSSTPPAAPRTIKQEELDDPANLPLKQKQLLEFLIIFPEYLQKFQEAGIEEVVDSSVGRNILHHLQDYMQDRTGSLEQLLDLAEGPEKSFISRLLITSPSYSDEDREEVAEEKLSWLKSNRHKALQEKLTRQIDEAQKSGNIDLCLDLIAKKNALDQEAD